ncbi:aspartate kinase [Bosea sp. 117]|uniref:amino acid kinase family protein n=1 Tax=Bosea sp. 117 TaxID=1125973 RepID=UPI000570C6F3|nr:aspartate kinase [Bosea sp. 117]
MKRTPGTPPRRQSPADVVKLGGSLVGDARLPALLAEFARIGAPLVVVGGGGPLADAVRTLQPRLGFGDAAAHHMAILAMEQTALALADLAPGLVPCADAGAIAQAHRAGRAALWRPAAMARAAQVPASWEVTSDSLALWLAKEIGAARLTLVKAAPVEDPHGPAAGWAAKGLVDPYFPQIAAGFSGAIEARSIKDALNRWKARAAA